MVITGGFKHLDECFVTKASSIRRFCANKPKRSINFLKSFLEESQMCRIDASLLRLHIFKVSFDNCALG
jgi:hypothetical protein